MNKEGFSRGGQISFLLSLLLIILVLVASSSGVFIKETYIREVKYFAYQGIGQDIVNLIIVIPAMIVTLILSYRKNDNALTIWTGILLYLLYSYAIYCFSMHFNFLFLVYCAIFGLSFYLFVFNLISLNISSNYSINNKLIKLTSIFLIFLSLLFYMLWLSEIITALIKNELPKSVIENGILTNPVHVLDLSIILPAFIITAILLMKRKPIAFILTPILLSFSLFMELAIIGMMIVLYLSEFENDISIAIIFTFITMISSTLLLIFMRNLKVEIIVQEK